MGSRIHREVYVRFRGEDSETCCCEAVRRRILSLHFIEILSAPCRLAVASASGGQCRYPVKAGGKTVYYKQNAYLRTIGHFLFIKRKHR